MKTFLVAVVLLLPWSYNQAKDLVVDANSVLLIDHSQQELQLDMLRIGDNARIEFAPDVDHWYIDALDARIGNNVVIDGRGQAGRAGVNGDNFDRLEPHRCTAGQRGDDGVGGENGRDGVEIRLRLGLSQLGGLSIDTSGGDGGAGGSGGNGQNMDALKNCKEGDGGNGGDGGDGGNGGQGGNLRLLLWGNKNFGPIAPHLNKVTAVASGGNPGRAGLGGNAGEGSAGSFIMRKTLAGDRKWEAGGDPGKLGESGADGSPGRDGNIELEEDTRGSQLYGPASADESTATGSPNNAPSATAADSARHREIEAIRQQLQELQRRLDALEGAH